MRASATGWVVLAACVCATAEAAQTWLRYRLSPCPQANVEIAYLPGIYERLSGTRPPELKTPPPNLSGKPFFGRVLGKRLVVLDRGRPNSSVYDLLWLDRNKDGRLSDDERFELKLAHQGYRGATVSLEFDGAILQIFTVLARVTSDMAFVQVLNAGYYSGDVAFGDKAYRVALVDRNANGLFNDATKDGVHGDLVLIDQNGDGRFDARRRESQDLFYVGKYVRVDGKFWRVVVAPDGAEIGVERAEPAMGRLQLDEKDVAIVIVGQEGRYCLSRETDGELFETPAGSYELESVFIRRETRDGRHWTLKSREGRKPFSVVENQTTKVNVGDPLVAVAMADRGGGAIRFNFDLLGEDGLSYQVLVDGSLGTAMPRLELKAKDGSWRKEHAFQYG